MLAGLAKLTLLSLLRGTAPAMSPGLWRCYDRALGASHLPIAGAGAGTSSAKLGTSAIGNEDR
jgi:hypothetical protein